MGSGCSSHKSVDVIDTKRVAIKLVSVSSNVVRHIELNYRATRNVNVS